MVSRGPRTLGSRLTVGQPWFEAGDGSSSLSPPCCGDSDPRNDLLKGEKNIGHKVGQQHSSAQQDPHLQSGSHLLVTQEAVRDRRSREKSIRGGGTMAQPQTPWKGIVAASADPGPR